MCLSALYANAGAAKSSQAQLIVCRDDHGHVAGAFLDEPIRNVGNYFGTGECFVFTVAGKSGPAAAEADVLPDPDMAIYRWVGPTESIPASALASTRGDLISEPRPFVNDMFVYTTHEVLGFGSGGGGFALRLDEAIERAEEECIRKDDSSAARQIRRENLPELYTSAMEFVRSVLERRRIGPIHGRVLKHTALAYYPQLVLRSRTRTRGPRE
ncbi:expressed protein [Aureococcus anophagefferens]|uniref:Oxidation resistance protein 1 n=1 Tax=Aureococcus anophagefferens TaxID=44056 RepID=F0Y6Z7_AURAN|nr:expressed protein [Aureococcus anophagefferens]EGB08882.1 expressed protein [Aureococcus anophagefferens]|eukprot:XP_009036019.1 expressed protein [Aureococcus anophagefferens]